eukprot:6491269-Amphidinium_carterae.1
MSKTGSQPTTPRELKGDMPQGDHPKRRRSLTMETVQRALEAQTKRRAAEEPRSKSVPPRAKKMPKSNDDASEKDDTAHKRLDQQ